MFLPRIPEVELRHHQARQETFRREAEQNANERVASAQKHEPDEPQEIGDRSVAKFMLGLISQLMSWNR